MNIIDFFLNNNFTTEYDGGLNSKTKPVSMHDLRKTFNIGEITEMARDYKGEHYKELAEIILENGAYDVAMNIALINRDYKLCETIHMKRQKVILNKNTYEQKWAVKKSPYNINNNINNNLDNSISDVNSVEHRLEKLRERIKELRALFDEEDMIEKETNDIRFNSTYFGIDYLLFLCSTDI